MSPLVCLLFSCIVAVSHSAPGPDVCQTWADLAKAETFPGAQSCTNNKTQHCTRIDCSGHFSIPAFVRQLPIKVKPGYDYCFGSQLNSCSDPVSIDFYLHISTENKTFTKRITHDSYLALPELNIPLTSPKLHFEFEKHDGIISFNVKLIVNIEYGGIQMASFEEPLIKNATLYTEHCDKPTPQDANTPSPEFISSINHCNDFGYTALTTQVSPTTQTYKPSSTLNKFCDIKTACSAHEFCGTNSTCTCNLESQLSASKDYCSPFSQVNQRCMQDNDCSFNEECSSQTCQCVQGYSYDEVRGMCVFAQHGQKPDSHMNSTAKLESPATTPSPHRSEEKPVKEWHNIPIYIGASVAGAMAIVLSIWGFIACRKKLVFRQLEERDAEIRSPMLGNDDDNLIM
ncbi:uncharacterized protein LOC131928108 [Physella acuta]|uniref:uncharacterized protein LOC131928108 n=1 Tax=Physella acuta TaxID=109671 RepID=UPI0027DC59EC|nr:uncharacterized protein LOC131928108 [Physella acuta]